MLCWTPSTPDHEPLIYATNAGNSPRRESALIDARIVRVAFVTEDPSQELQVSTIVVHAAESGADGGLDRPDDVVEQRTGGGT